MRRLDTIYRIKSAKEKPQRLQFYVFPRPKSFSAAIRLISARIFVLILIVTVSYNFYTFFIPQASASNFTKKINYQGKITDASNIAIADNPYCFKFRLMDDLDPAPPENEVWNETYTGGNKITTTSGLFSTMLGSQSDISGVNFDDVLYLEVQFDPACNGDYEEVFAPRKILGAVPAAFEADKLDGIDSGSFARSDADDTITGLWTITKAPAGAGVNQGSLYINPAAANADETLFGVALNGAERFRVDEDGDLTAPGTYNTNTFTSSALTFGDAGAASISSAAAQQLTIDSGTTGSLSIGTGASAKTIIIGNETGASSLELDSGTGAISIGNAIAKTITLGNVTGATAVNLNSGTGGFLLTSTGAGDFTVASGDDVVINGAGANAAISIGTSAVAHTIIIGNETGASSLELDSGTGAISIGNAIAKTITLGNVTGATAVNLNSGTGGFLLTSTGAGDFTVASGDDVVINGAGANAAISIGTSAVAHTITLGNVTGATGLVFNTGTAGIDFGDNANTKAIHIGGVTNSGTDTISIATNSTAADVITIGNDNAATTTTFPGTVDIDMHMSLGIGSNEIPITPQTGIILYINDTPTTNGVNYGIYLLESALNVSPSTYYGIYSKLEKSDAGTIANLYNFYAASPTASAGSITNNYGLYVADQLGGGVDVGIAIAGADTYALWISSGADNTDAANGITFGSSGDTNLYRLAANALATDDDLVIGGSTNGAGSLANILGTGVLAYGAICADDTLDTSDDCIDAARAAGTVYGISSSFTIDDLAENFPTLDAQIEAGDIVSLDYQAIPANAPPEGPDQKYETEFVKKSASLYDQGVLGIVSEKPGILLGGWGQNKDPRSVKEVAVALLGRLPIKVSIENGPIEPGDPLTSSSSPGVAMKATQSGPVVAKALESFDGSSGETGKIVAFVSVSYYISEGDIAKLNSEINTESGGLVGSIKSGFSDLAEFFKSGLEQLGIFVENGVVKAKEFIADKITAKLARVEKLEMVDKATGEIYCTWIENGEWKKTKGECDSASGGNEQPSGESQPPQPEPPPSETPTEPPPIEEPPLPEQPPAETPPVEEPVPPQEPLAIAEPSETPNAEPPAGTSAAESLPAS